MYQMALQMALCSIESSFTRVTNGTLSDQKGTIINEIPLKRLLTGDAHADLSTVFLIN